MTSNGTDRRLAAVALEKKQRGEAPTAQEQSALARVEKQREEELRWEYYQAIPKKHWCELSGRQYKVLNEQADRYGIPLRGPTVNLAEVARWMHDFLAKHGHKVQQPAEDDPLLAGVDSPALERYRNARADREEMNLAELRGELIRREQVRQFFYRFAQLMRQMAATLEKLWGGEAKQVVDETLDDAERLIGEVVDKDASD